MWWPVLARWQRRVAARTRFFDEITLSVIEAGVTQVVVVGAGYDGRALRFAAPGVRFFEIDHPATQSDKRQRIEALGIRPDAVTYIPHDLTHGELSEELAAAGHNGERATLFICEGLLMYLTPTVIHKLLRDLQSCAGPGSRLALDAGERLPGAPATASARVDFQRLLLAALGEPRQSDFEPGQLDEALRSTGWGTVRELGRIRAGRKGMLILAEPCSTPTVAPPTPTVGPVKPSVQ